MSDIERPCIRLIIAADELALADGSEESMKYGLDLAREIGQVPLADSCRLEYGNNFYCDESWSVDCQLRKALRN